MLNGLILDKRNNTSANWRSIFKALTPNDGYLSGCEINFTANTITVGSGYLIACGAIVQNEGDETIDATPSVSSGFARLKLVVDLTQEASASDSAQTYWAVEYSATETFPALTQEDITGGGSVYEMMVAIFTISGGNITGVSEQMSKAAINMAAVLNADNFTSNGDKLYVGTANTKVLTAQTGQLLRIWAGASNKEVVLHGTKVVAQNYADTALAPMQASSFSQSSSLRYKENIEDINNEEAEKIYKVNVVTYNYKNDEEKKTRCGVIAEQLEEVGINTPILYDENGNPDTVSYPDLVPYLIKIVQLQKAQIDELYSLIKK